jgi:hypothetical protein
MVTCKDFTFLLSNNFLWFLILIYSLSGTSLINYDGKFLNLYIVLVFWYYLLPYGIYFNYELNLIIWNTSMKHE